MRRVGIWARFILTLPYSLAGVLYAIATGGRFRWRAGLVLERWESRNRLGGPQVTIGSVVINRWAEPMTEVRLRHETRHVIQWAAMGPVFPIAYAIAHLRQGECNVFERWAGFEDGGYTRCLDDA